jgi:hypothetical protein
MDDGNQIDRLFLRKVAVLGWIGVPVLYGFLIVRYPEYWAIAIGIIVVIATGLFTTKIILGLENAWAAFGLAPLFGTGWLAFFWLIFRLAA